MSAPELRSGESANNLSKPFTMVEVGEVPAFKPSCPNDDKRSRSLENAGFQK